MSPLPSEGHFREMSAARVSGAALDAPRIGPDEDQGIGQSSLDPIARTESSHHKPWSLEFSGHFAHSIETWAALFMAQRYQSNWANSRCESHLWVSPPLCVILPAVVGAHCK